MIAIIDLKIGNVGSMLNAFRYLKIDAMATYDLDDIKKADKIVIPGVGTFAEASRKLKNSGIGECIIEEARSGKSILGVCLGMQLLAVSGEEGDEKACGLGLIDGIVNKIECEAHGVRLPHVGWNEVHFCKQCVLFKNIEQDSCFYFAHSYAINTSERECVAAVTNHGCDFTAAVFNGNVFGTQFHPEKSRANGLRVLKNFCEV
jgi:glutamine amidotransferase